MNDGLRTYSVLMSVYHKDVPQYLSESIESILRQTIPPDQIVLVKDGPLCKELEDVLSRYVWNEDIFTVVSLEKNGGLANALNVGIDYCRNELIARMDADDISLPDRCEEELKRFQRNPALAVCGCNMDEFYETTENRKTTRAVPEKYYDILKFMRRRQAFNHPTVMYRKTKVMEAGGYPPLKRKEDFDLFSRMTREGYILENINASLYLYRADEKNYARRKSWENFKSALYVYWRHLRRGGCSVWDFILICAAEFVFLILPLNLMKLLSDRVLRRRITGESGG